MGLIDANIFFQGMGIRIVRTNALSFLLKVHANRLFKMTQSSIPKWYILN